MEPQTKTSAKDFFLNLGVIVALYTTVVALLNLLFTVINRAYPQITNNFYGVSNSSSISWPVAVLIIFFPVFVLLIWLLERGYKVEPEKRHITVKRWLTYITLFITGIAMAIDLVTILYYFIDGQELTMAFVMKILAVFIVTLAVFLYYISEIREKLNDKSRKIWLTVAVVIILSSIVWGFAVLGSPRTQRLYKYDDQKVNDLTNINSAIQNYYSTKSALPKDFTELGTINYYVTQLDAQTQKPYEYKITGSTTYELCADFNKASPDTTQPSNYTRPIGYTSWTHPVGRYCFTQAISPNQYGKPVLLP
jgi:uncharacterized membrane protein/type II secretory pathway pseudopilin PulG